MEAAPDRREPAPAGFWIRFVALGIDAVVVIIVQALFGLAAARIWGRDLLESQLFYAVVTPFTLLFAAAYSVVLHAREGQTIGKMMVKVRVERVGGRPLSSGRALLRWIAPWMAALPLFLGLALAGLWVVAWIGALPSLLGFALAGLRRDKRGLHDLLAGTRVVRARS